MCRYVVGQKIELWRIDSERHPHRVVERAWVTIERFVGTDRHGDGQSLVAVTEIGRVFLKTRAYFTPQVFLECRHIWWAFCAESELWVEAVLAATYAHHHSRPFHYSDGHGHEVKPSGDAMYCKEHHLWQHAGWPCPERGRAVKTQSIDTALAHVDA